jgi:hypothetical protein
MANETTGGCGGRIESDLRGERTPNSGNGEVTMKMKPLVTTLTGTTTKCLVTIVASMGLGSFLVVPGGRAIPGLRHRDAT